MGKSPKISHSFQCLKKLKEFERIMTMKKAMTIFMLLAVLTACTDKRMTRRWGSAYRIELPKGKHLLEVTWKEDNLWMLTCPMDSDYKPKTYNFTEDSSWGLYEGEITIVESK